MRKHRYKILYRNFKDRRGGEIDIVCREGDTLVFVEVKTRGGEEFGRPIEAVNRQPVKTVDDLRTAIRKTTDRPALLLINRKGSEIFVTVRPANG